MNDINYCQESGVEILLSVGGADFQAKLRSAKEAERMADKLVKYFVNGKGGNSPLGR